MDVQELQRQALMTMLSMKAGSSDLNDPALDSAADITTWKILVYDDVGRDVLAPILPIAQLRSLGVTLNLPLKSRRERVPGVPAIYLCAPTEENINIIAKDAGSGLYDQLFLYFTTTLPRVLLEDLALKCIETNSASRISKIVDLNNQFVALEPSLFTLNIVNSYSRLSSHDDADIMACVDSVTSALYSLVCSLGVVPIIYARQGEAAEIVGEKLDQRLRETLRSRPGTFQSAATASFHRPALIIVDRNLDLATPLQHAWTYQPMTHDLLDLHGNRVALELKGPGGMTRREDIYLDQSDDFWASNRFQTFPEVAARVEQLMKEHHATMQGLRSSGDPNDIDLDSPAVTSQLASMVQDVPAMLKRKRQLDIHTNLATLLMRSVQERGLDMYFETEDRMAASGLLPDNRTLLSRLGPEAKGTPDDKLRLLLSYYLASDEIPQAQLTAFTEALVSSGASTLALDYVRRVRMMRRIATKGQHDDTKSLLQDLAKSTAFGWLKGNVRNLLPLKHKTPLTRAVADILLRPSSSGGFRMFDPRSGSGSASAPSRMAKPRDAIVVVCGGGSYLEAHNLFEFARDSSANSPSQAPISIVYGCTDLVSPTAMLRQMESLANSSPDAVDLK